MEHHAHSENINKLVALEMCQLMVNTILDGLNKLTSLIIKLHPYSRHYSQGIALQISEGVVSMRLNSHSA